MKRAKTPQEKKVLVEAGSSERIAARDAAEKKIPGKKTPPTLTLKHGKKESTAAALSPTKHKNERRCYRLCRRKTGFFDDFGLLF